MKASPKILLALTAVATLSIAYPAKANLITNGGFETGDFSGWSVSGPASVEGTVGSIPPHSGNFQAQLDVSASIGQTLATTPGQVYLIDLWAAAPMIQGGSLFVFWNGIPAAGFAQSSVTPYEELCPSVIATSASTTLLFEVTRGRILLDDISVNRFVPDGGSTVSLLGCALLGLAAFRRKLRC
jgi:hypothetical protein